MDVLNFLFSTFLQFVDFILHLDKHLVEIVKEYGFWVYFILFGIVFAETGFVVTPFLPGDSLLFACGALAATGGLNPHLIAAILALAAILGDTVNYWLGHYIGARIFKKEKSWFFNPAHLVRTQKFYDKHGGKTIIIARFVPIIRTFAPFVAGIGSMNYTKFIFYNVTGAILWVAIVLYAGFFFGNLEIVKNNFSLVIISIIIISVLPAVYEFLKHRNDPEDPVSLVNK